MLEYKLVLELGSETEEITQRILDALGDDLIDEVQIERKIESSTGLAGEPITISSLVVGSSIVISAALRVLERYMEIRRQEGQMRIVAEGFDRDAKLGQALADLAASHASISVSHGYAKEAWGKISS